MKAPKKQITVAAMAATLTLTTTVTAPPVLVCAQESLDTTQQEMTKDVQDADAQVQKAENPKDNIKEAVSAVEKKAEDTGKKDNPQTDKAESKKETKPEADNKAVSSAKKEKVQKDSQKKAVKKQIKKAVKHTTKKEKVTQSKKAEKTVQKKAESNSSNNLKKTVQKKAEEAAAVKINDKNFPDKAFQKYVSEKFDIDKDGALSQKEIKAVTKIDVSGRSLTSLKGIEHFTALTYLDCSKTGITGLDVSKNTALSSLTCTDTKLAWLNTGKNSNLKKKEIKTEISLAADSSSFDISKEFSGIDASRIENMTGAKLTKETVSGYSYNAPVTYEYSTADNQKEEPVLKVTLNLKAEKTAAGQDEVMESKAPETKKAIPEYTVPTDLKATYGQMLSDVKLPAHFSWQVEDPGKTPVGNVGNNTFQVTFTPDDTTNYETVKDINVTVTVSLNNTKKANSWTKELSIAGWTYGKYDNTKNAPSASAQLGTVTYAYASSENGTYTADVPTKAGTWYVKAVVIETNEFEGLESKPVSFTIAKATPDYTVPSSLKATYGDKLKDVALPDGFAWESSSKSVGKAGKNTFKATFTPADSANYNAVQDIDVDVTVEQAENSRTEKLTIKGWTYGEKANKPEYSSKFGKAEYSYSDKEDGTYKSSAPTTAGTWYVKATVEETDNYTGLESKPVSFKIAPKDGTKLTIPAITSTTDTTKLAIKDGNTTLVSGRDYTITKKQTGSTVTVTIAFKGNYTGTVTRTYTASSTSGTTSSTAPRTGDSTDVGLWSSAFLLSGGLLAFLTRKRRKEAKAEEE